jgi:hypothetical protein
MQDLRDAARALRSSPLLSAAALLSLALGIGANTAIFSILNSLLLKPLPVRDPLGSTGSTEFYRVLLGSAGLGLVLVAALNGRTS